MRKLFILSLLAMMIAIGGCGSGGTSADPLGTDGMMFGHKEDEAGTEWSTAMTVGPRGTVILTAKVKNASGAAVVGREVDFWIWPNVSGATLSSTRDSTDYAGEASTIYTAGMFAGFDVVRASISNGATLDTNITVDVSPSAVSIIAGADPTTLASNAASSVVTATVTDNLGTGVSGVTVNFTVLGVLPLGTLSAASATTDGSGNAVTTVTGNGVGATGATSVVTASITVGGNTYTNAVVITYP